MAHAVRAEWAKQTTSPDGSPDAEADDHRQWVFRVVRNGENASPDACAGWPDVRCPATEANRIAGSAGGAIANYVRLYGHTVVSGGRDTGLKDGQTQPGREPTGRKARVV